MTADDERRSAEIPNREAWLHSDPDALAAVTEGLAQAKAGEFVEGPDLESDDVDLNGDYRMTTTELLAAIDKARGELAEARRYVRSKPQEAADGVQRFADQLDELRTGSMEIASRCGIWLANLDFGLTCTRTDPEVLENYLYNTAFELCWIRSRIEKGAKS